MLMPSCRVCVLTTRYRDTHTKTVCDRLAGTTTVPGQGGEHRQRHVPKAQGATRRGRAPGAVLAVVPLVVARRNKHGKAGATVEEGWHHCGATPLSKHHGGATLSG